MPKARRRAPRARSHRPQRAGNVPSIVKQDGPTSVAAGELTSMVETMTSAGPPESVGLLDHLDAGLDRLKKRHRQVLLMSFGGTGEMPLKLDEIGRRISVTRHRVRQIQVHALASLPAIAGPPFGAALRDLGDRVSAEGADVAAELERSWRKEPPDSARVPRPWANNGFYLRLLTKLSSVIEAAVFPPTARAAAVES